MLKIGTDCSGIEAPIQALKQLNIEFSHEFSSEIDKYAIQSINANYNPKKIYADITKRNHRELPDIDVYVAGFPCQPFSSAGLQKGMEDARSNVMLECISVIKIKQPPIFILENVKNFKNVQKGEPFNYLLNELNSIKKYNIHVDLLNTKHYGIPQNRERLFIIGIKKELQQKEYTTPERIQMKELKTFLVDDKIEFNSKIPNQVKFNYIKNSHKTKKGLQIVSTGQFGTLMNDIIPSLTCSHIHYIYNYRRYLTPRECLNLQGFNNDFKQVVSNRQMYKQIGNSMSVNVLMYLFEKVFDIIKKEHQDNS